MNRTFHGIFRLITLFSFLLTIATTFVRAGDDKDKYIQVYYRQSISGNYDFYAKNLNYCPYQLEVVFTKLMGAEITSDLPYYSVIEAQSKEQYLFSIRPKNVRDFSFKYSYNFWMGDPAQVIPGDQSEYVLPFRVGTSLKVTQGYNGKYSHANTNALDFELTESTAICAARDGVVVQVKEDSKQGGPDKSFANDCNYITVYQSDGTLAEYVHLKHNGSIVSVGDTVRASQVIGYGGNTGWSTSPHLHFCVKQPVKMGYQSLPVMFYSAKGKQIALEEKRSYKAYALPTEQERVAQGQHARRLLFGLLHSSAAASNDKDVR